MACPAGMLVEPQIHWTKDSQPHVKGENDHQDMAIETVLKMMIQNIISYVYIYII